MTRGWRRRRLGWLCATIAIAGTAAGLDDATLGRPQGALRSPAGSARPQSYFATIDHAALAPSRRARSEVTWIGGPTTARTGETVTVYVSAALPPGSGTPQSWADRFAGLVHGGELSSLRAHLATHTEIQSICGGDDALGCYGGGELFAIGEPLPWADPVAVATHEYGHHVAANRDNSPWRAVDWGTKRWASLTNICARTANSSVFPGDEADRYLLNPGEGFAEVYRAANEARRGATSFAWEIVDRSFYPDAAALGAAEQDVLDPWTQSPATTTRAAFTKKGKRTWSRSLATPLDGQLTATLSLPATRPYKVSLLGDGKVLAVGAWSGTKVQTLSFTICGQRSLVVRVSRVGPAGRFTLALRKP